MEDLGEKLSEEEVNIMIFILMSKNYLLSENLSEEVSKSRKLNLLEHEIRQDKYVFYSKMRKSDNDEK